MRTPSHTARVHDYRTLTYAFLPPKLSLVSALPLFDPRPAESRHFQVPSPPPPPPIRDDLRRLRESLDPALASKLMNASELQRSLDRKRRDSLIPTTLDAFDTLLGGGLPRGRMVELVGRRWSAGRFSLVLSALASATSMGEAAVLIDLGDHLDPQLAEQNGVELARVLWVRPKTMKQAVMSAEMLAATGFQLIVLDAGLPPLRGKRAPDAAWVRLARAAEAHGTALLISSPWPVTGTASEAVVLAERTRTHWLGRGKSPRLLAGVSTELRLEKHRHMKAGTSARLVLEMLDLWERPSSLTGRPEQR